MVPKRAPFSTVVPTAGRSTSVMSPSCSTAKAVIPTAQLAPGRSHS
jgi:hypothetical protein